MVEREDVVVRRITTRMEKLGAFVINVHGDIFSKRGLPDLIVIMEGTVTFLEVKRPGGKPSKMQLYIQNKIRRRGVESWIVSSLEEAERAVEQSIGIH